MATHSVSVSALTFSDRTLLQLAKNDIVVFIGPNNAGKSAALRNIKDKAVRLTMKTEVISNLTFQFEGLGEPLEPWLEKSFRSKMLDSNLHYYSIGGRAIAVSIAVGCWARHEYGLEYLAPFFVYLLTTEDRLKASDPAENIALATEPLTHPIHFLQVDDRIEDLMSGYFRKAFGYDLMVHRNAGKNVPLYCGKRPSVTDNRTSIPFYRALESLPRLDSQGDGMRSFVGVLLYSLVGKHSILLIDEPEAFLHPPQARLIGQMLASEIPSDRQVFIGTHSGDFLRGILDVNSSRVRIVRLQREGDINRTSVLNNADIAAIWSDPLLRHSNILDWLFHNKVVVCEADSDCRFYAAINGALDEPTTFSQRQDVMFTHCGGKDRMATVVKGLRGVGIPVHVVPDFDVLQNDQTLRAIYEGLGGKWSDIEPCWKIVKKALDGCKSEISTEEARKEITAVLDKAGRSLSKAQITEIRDTLRRSSPWSIAKRTGVAFVPNGDSSVACEQLLKDCREKGLFVVPVGELESFAKTVGAHGPEWVNTVLATKDLRADSNLEAARTFVREFTA
jgi:hypothetical protein